MSTSCVWLMDANCSSVSLANHAAVLPGVIMLTAWEVADHRFPHPYHSVPPTPLLVDTVCGHVAPSGQTVWRMELCHFADCFPGIVFLDVSAVLGGAL